MKLLLLSILPPPFVQVPLSLGSIFKSEPHNRVTFTNSRTAKKKVRSMKRSLSSATTNSITLMPEDSAAVKDQ